jgi:hypothetical protein
LRPASAAIPGKPGDLAAPGFAAAVVLAAATLLAQTGFITASGYRLNQLERSKDDLERQNQQLASQVALLRSLTHAEDVARSRWKMAPPTQVLYLDLQASEGPAAATPLATTGR